MKKLPSLLVYTVLRLLVFIVPFLLLMIFPIFREQYWLAAIFAALIGVSLSVLFLRRPFDASNTPAPKAPKAKRADDAFEDDVIDGSAASDSAMADDAATTGTESANRSAS